MPNLGYARDKLGLAVDALVGVGDYRQRLLAAYDHLGWLSQPGHLPEDLAVKIEGFREALSWLPPSEANPEEGNVVGTLREMPAEEYEELAHLVATVFQEVVERSAAGSE